MFPNLRMHTQIQNVNIKIPKCPFSVFVFFEISRSFEVVSGSSILPRAFLSSLNSMACLAPKQFLFHHLWTRLQWKSPCSVLSIGKVGFPNTGRGWCCLLAQLHLYSQWPESGLQDLLLTYTVHPRNWTTTCFFNGVLIFLINKEIVMIKQQKAFLYCKINVALIASPHPPCLVCSPSATLAFDPSWRTICRNKASHQLKLLTPGDYTLEYSDSKPLC